MCGIAGIINYQGLDGNVVKRAKAMQQALLHRGPDGQGQFESQNVLLTHTRLALIDLEQGTQPFTSPGSRYALTYNGEVYNYRELKKELSQAWEFRTESDTEVVLAAFATWGEKCLTKLNGMFAFFIWDEKEQTGFAARDLLGIKPFVYSQAGDTFLFASEAKGLLASGLIKAGIHEESFLEYLAAPYFSGVEHPMFNSMEYLLPGHCMRIRRQGISVNQWGDYNLKDALIKDPLQADHMRGLLRNAVRGCMIADVPVGTYLSGGLDSTLITALAAEHAGAGLCSYTVQFEQQDRFDYVNSMIVISDDAPYAVSSAAEIGVRQEFVMVPRNSIIDGIKEISSINDSLPAWEQELSQHYLARNASQRYKAVLVGDAADETHYGYQFLLDPDATSSPGKIISRFGIPPLRKGLIDNPLEYFDSKYRTMALSAGHTWDSQVNRSLATTYLIVKRWLARLLHNGDIHAMAFSIEARVPFADINLLDFAKRVHPEMGYHNGIEKHFLREAAKGLMPEKVRHRPKSALPKDLATDGVYRKGAATVLEKHYDLISYYLDWNAVQALVSKPEPLTEPERAMLFRLMAVCFWSDRYGVY